MFYCAGSNPDNLYALYRDVRRYNTTITNRWGKSDILIVPNCAMLWVMSWHGSAFRIIGPLCGEPPATGGSPHKGPVMRSFYIFFLVTLTRYCKNSRVEGDLRRPCNDTIITGKFWNECSFIQIICVGTEQATIHQTHAVNSHSSPGSMCL